MAFRGFTVTGIELGSQLARKAKLNVCKFTNATILEGDFDTEELDPDFSKIRYFSANEVRKKGIQEVIEEIGKKVKGKIYFSIDMDGIDPSEAPGVGTPEPYGISSTEVRSLINHFAKRIIGFDIVEMTPVYDNGNTSMLAAKFVQDFIGSKERQA